VLKLLICEAVRVDAIVAAVRWQRVLGNVGSPEDRLVLDVDGAGVVVVLRRYGIDVVGSAAVMGDVCEELVDRVLVAGVERERRRARGSDGLRERVWNRCPGQLASGVRNDTENPRAGRASGGAAGCRDGERQPCEHENLAEAR